MKRIPLIKPYITEAVKARVCQVLDSGHLTEGSVARELEDAFRTYIGCRHAIAVTSCTTGLEIALRAIGVGPGDEVIIPDYTYPATGDVVAIVGARAVVVDISPDTMLIDYDKVPDAITPKTKAIMPVSCFGNPLDYGQLDRLKQKYGLYVIEDAACSLGAEFKGSKVGSLADISVFSMHPRKFITTGEGGTITTNNPQWAKWMQSYKHFGMGQLETGAGISFESIGTNYKLSDILAAIGLAQMEQIDKLLEQRRILAQNYTDLLSSGEEVTIPETTRLGKHSYQSFCIFIENRDSILAELRRTGIEVQIGTYALHREPAFASGPHCRISSEPINSQYAYDRCLTLPLYHGMSDDDQKYVVEKLTSLLHKQTSGIL